MVMEEKKLVPIGKIHKITLAVAIVQAKMIVALKPEGKLLHSLSKANDIIPPKKDGFL